MTTHLSTSGYICDFCPQKIEKEEDGLIIFGSICKYSSRGLKTSINITPDETNAKTIGETKTCICWKCFAKKVGPQNNNVPNDLYEEALGSLESCVVLAEFALANNVDQKKTLESITKVANATLKTAPSPKPQSG
jgi:hypothetical protein